MSVDATSSLPDPGYYGYPATFDTSALSSGSSTSSGSAAASSSGNASASSNAPAVSSYQSAYDNLIRQDNAELMNVSLGSASNAQSNVGSVLAQAAALQQQQLAAQQQAQSAAPPVFAAPAVPDYTSLVAQSDANASSDLANGTLGASVDTTA